MDLQITPSDTEILDWLDRNASGFGDGWVCRKSVTGRGLRLHETTNYELNKIMRYPNTRYMTARPTIRGAIIQIMESNFSEESVRFIENG